jgi:IS5 family transposase
LGNTTLKKAHIGVVADSGLAHTVNGTAASVKGVNQERDLLHGEERVVFAVAGYYDATKLLEAACMDWRIACVLLFAKRKSPPLGVH